MGSDVLCDHALFWDLSNIQSLVVGIHTTLFQIQKLCALPTECVCVSYNSHNKMRLFPGAELRKWFL
jgi:hypothetical protein